MASGFCQRVDQWEEPLELWLVSEAELHTRGHFIDVCHGLGDLDQPRFIVARDR